MPVRRLCAAIGSSCEKYIPVLAPCRADQTDARKDMDGRLMDFEANRLAVLKRLEEVKKNREVCRQGDEAAKPLVTVVLPVCDNPSARPLILVFGAATSYRSVIVEYLVRTCRVVCFEDSEAAIDYCLAEGVYNIVLDMDPPTDWRCSTDLHSAVKTMHPDARFLFCSRKPNSPEVKSLAAHGGIVTEIPVLSRKLADFLEHCR